ncbi:thiamine phosphate synthase [Aliiruegeria sabulilitoris]|uniref:thiamine phosphate synthase n=1 Tax=Aliiruegeria sabulilitoris TaxID=1510458 RepID=UPI00082E9AEA|nr:thiamine phosphate synthase [Aliiruegeria sabulilitoris]NDR59153.1 thiamine phosphate synthase [Pseudoruegeria sp. M32A2M]
MRKQLDLSAYLVLDPCLCAGLGMVETARAAVAGGVGVVQLRHKQAGTAEMIAIGRALQAVLAGTGAALVVNDDVAAAKALGADGLHIGQGDMAVKKARSVIGPEMVLGLSVENVAHARAVDPKVVDYVGVSPVFGTPTKSDHAPPVGIDGLRRIVEICPIPAVGIGGLGPQHADDVIGAGAAGLAVVSAICGQPDPEAAARALVSAVKEARG